MIDRGREHEAPLVASWLVADVPPVVACIPPAWFTDPDAETIWRELRAGASVSDAYLAARRRGGDGVLRWILRAIRCVRLGEIRWHAHLIYTSHQRRAVQREFPRWVKAAERGELASTPELWPCWEAAAIAAEPDPTRAGAALLDEQRRGERWTEDRMLLWALSARIEASMPPI